MQAQTLATVRAPSPVETLPSPQTLHTGRLPRNVRRLLDRKSRMQMLDNTQPMCSVTGRP